MRAGPLRHRISIQSATDAQSDSGEVTKTWSTVTRWWASIEPLSGREYMATMQARSESLVRIRMRYYPALTTQHRIVFEDERADVARTFEINDVLHLNERQRETHAMCREAV